MLVWVLHCAKQREGFQGKKKNEKVSTRSHERRLSALHLRILPINSGTGEILEERTNQLLESEDLSEDLTETGRRVSGF